MITNINFKNSIDSNRQGDGECETCGSFIVPRLKNSFLTATTNLRTNPTYISNNGDEPAWNPQEAYARFDKLLHTIQFSPLSQPKFKNRNYYDLDSANIGPVPSQKSHGDNKRSMPIPYRPFQPGFFSENDSTVDQLLDELNMAEEYSNDRRRLRDHNSQSAFANATASDPTIANIGGSNYWDSSILSDAETNGFLNKNIDSYNRYRDHDTKQRLSAGTVGSGLQFQVCMNNDNIGQSPKRSTSNVQETGSESSRSSVPGWTYRHPIIMQSIKSTMGSANANKRKNNLSKASMSPNLNVSFLTESEKLAKIDLFLLPSDDSGGGQSYSAMADTSPSGDCSELMQVSEIFVWSLLLTFFW